MLVVDSKFNGFLKRAETRTKVEWSRRSVPMLSSLSISSLVCFRRCWRLSTCRFRHRLPVKVRHWIAKKSYNCLAIFINWDFYFPGLSLSRFWLVWFYSFTFIIVDKCFQTPNYLFYISANLLKKLLIMVVKHNQPFWQLNSLMYWELKIHK